MSQLGCPVALALCSLLASAATAAAEPAWRSAVQCAIDAEPGSGLAHVSPLHDDKLAELESFGSGYRVVGNKSFTRLPSHSWVAFTFDDGPQYKNTPRVLAALEKYDVPATFFVNAVNIVPGRYPAFARRNAALLRDMVRRGFHIGNHTFHHKHLDTLPPRLFKEEIEASAQAIEAVTGIRPYLVRLPYGTIDQKLRAYLAQEGYTEVRWSIDTHDFSKKRRRTLRKRTLKQIVKSNGGVVLLHDPKPQTGEMLGGLLDDLEALNCQRLVTQETLLIPVSLHYFAREADGSPRPVPPEVAARTERYMKELPARCAARNHPRVRTATGGRAGAD